MTLGVDLASIRALVVQIVGFLCLAAFCDYFVGSNPASCGTGLILFLFNAGLI